MMKELGRPKKQPAAYNIYLTSRKGTKNKDESMKVWLIRL